jgi:hypothetical protein
VDVEPDPRLRENAAQTLSFVTTVQASLDARALLSPRLNRFDILADVAAIVGGLILAFGGWPIGLVLSALAVVFLVGTRFQPVLRWRLAHDGRSMLGKPVEVRVGEGGLRYSGELGASEFPWSSITRVSSSLQTVAFIRDRILVGYIPASAFTSLDDQAELVRYARDRIAGASPAVGGPKVHPNREA